MRKILFLVVIISVILSCKSYYNISNVEKSGYSISSQFPEKSQIKTLITPYKVKLDSEMNRILSYSPIELKKGFNATLPNLAADLILEESNKIYEPLYHHKIDVALLNDGGLRRTFSKGNLTVGNIYELMPFDNLVVVMTLSGKDFLNLIEYLKNDGRAHAISGFTFNLDKDDSNLKINGKPFDINKNYTIVTSDFLSKGGDNMLFFKSALKQENLNIMVRDMMLEYFAKNDTLSIDTESRYLR